MIKIDYYKAKRQFGQDILTFLEKNKGESIPVDVLELKFCQRYGFGRQALIKRLGLYQRTGMIELIGDLENDGTVKVL